MKRNYQRYFAWAAMGAALILFYGCDSRRLGKITESIRREDKVVLYEGLPHPQTEAASYEKEKRSNATETFSGFDFYQSALELKSDDARKLSLIFGEPKSFQPVRKKLCGGFHPDYAIQWGSGGNRTEALVCFGCEEVMLLSHRVLPVRQDLQDGVFEQVRGILNPYRQKRPALDLRIK